jgi:hypothetical protein
LKEFLLKILLNNKPRLTADEIEVRVRAFVIIMVTFVFCFITFALLYSVTFVSQPVKTMAPIDQAYTKMLNDIVLLIVGGIGGILTKGVTTEARAMLDAAKTSKDAYVAPPPPPVQNITVSSPNWTPPPAPRTPPTLEGDDERMRTAEARESARC